MTDYILYFLILLGAALGFDWYSRSTFISSGYCNRYGHGKSWKRAHKHYKTNWTFWQRMFWMPVFKEPYESDFRLLAYFSYLQSFLSIVFYVLFIVSDIYFPESKVYKYVLYVFYAIFLLRYIHIDYVGTKGHRRRNGKKY